MNNPISDPTSEEAKRFIGELMLKTIESSLLHEIFANPQTNAKHSTSIGFKEFNELAEKFKAPRVDMPQLIHYPVADNQRFIRMLEEHGIDYNLPPDHISILGIDIRPSAALVPGTAVMVTQNGKIMLFNLEDEGSESA